MEKGIGSIFEWKVYKFVWNTSEWGVIFIANDFCAGLKKMSSNSVQQKKGECCDVAVAQINYPSFKHNTQDSIEQARGRSHEEVSSQIFMLYVM